MARLGFTFDASEFDTTQTEYESLPLGIYRFNIDSTDIAPTSNGNGTILKVTLSVIEPSEFEGRKFWTNYNLENKNIQAQEIGQRDFAKLCKASDAGPIDDSDLLHGRSFYAKLRMGKDSKERNADGSPKYPAKPEIGRYYFPGEDEEPTPGIDADQPAPAAKAPANDNRPAQRQAEPARAAAGSRPWGQKK